MPRVYNAIGLMSGTSLDGVDVALLETNGVDYVFPKGFFYAPYPDSLKQRIRASFGLREQTEELRMVERDLTLAHRDAVLKFLRQEDLGTEDIDLIGFHGQTITHDPDHGFTWQIGDGPLLARELGVDVVYDFRTADVKAGGQGAPLLPLYHRARALSSNLVLPVAILNIGGVSNVTWLGEDSILAFDTGPGNALIDDCVLKETGEKFDRDGLWARQGQTDYVCLSNWLSHPYFSQKPAKSLDRGAWDVQSISKLSFVDALATLTCFTIAANVKAGEHFPAPPLAWYVTGGGRNNTAIMEGLQKALGVPVLPVDTLGWNGDALEAEGFAYLAVRSVMGLPLSVPGTTKVPCPQTGGILAPKWA
jgi:anhydro-N-acetylmuramic acid kinase